ncbi:MAG: hypothetical protein PHC61_15900 [Chitinivibrionales bacterium]|nr:hypothetical protein [Chitinivibrionales bacterium]
MPDESRYPTMKLLRCKKCGAVFTVSVGSSNECPECSYPNEEGAEFRPGQNNTPPAADAPNKEGNG